MGATVNQAEPTQRVVGVGVKADSHCRCGLGTSGKSALADDSGVLFLGGCCTIQTRTTGERNQFVAN